MKIYNSPAEQIEDMKQNGIDAAQYATLNEQQRAIFEQHADGRYYLRTIPPGD